MTDHLGNLLLFEASFEGFDIFIEIFDVTCQMFD